MKKETPQNRKEREKCICKNYPGQHGMCSAKGHKELFDKYCKQSHEK